MLICTHRNGKRAILTKALLHFESNFIDEAGGKWVNDSYPSNWAVGFDFRSKIGNSCLSSIVDGGTGFYHKRLKYTGGQDLSLTSGDFTIEAYAYVYYYVGTIFTNNAFGAGCSGTDITIRYVTEDGVIQYSYPATTNIHEWYHFAFVRSGNTNRLFINGILTDERTSKDFIDSSDAYIGYVSRASSTRGIMIDELRISACARWTANFTPPTARYELD